MSLMPWTIVPLLASDIAFLKDTSAGTITLVCSIPAILFCLYVTWDDRRHAKQHAHHGAPGVPGAAGAHEHSPPHSPPHPHH